MYIEEDSSFIFGLPFRQFNAVSAILSNVYYAAVEENLLDYFLNGRYNYYYEDNSFSLEYVLCDNNIILAFDIDLQEDGNIVASWDITSSYKYNLSSWYKEEFDWSLNSNIDNEVHIVMNYIKTLIQSGEK